MNADEKKQKLLETLGKSLTLEYSLIIHYPRIATIFRDKKTRNLVNSLGIASIKHANTIADTIVKLGGKPQWSFDDYPDGENLGKIFKQQLEKENLALELHQQCVKLADNISIANHFKKIAEDEKKHITVVNRIISKLKEPAT
jgi:bacterioferritin (cytochrome b1)